MRAYKCNTIVSDQAQIRGIFLAEISLFSYFVENHHVTICDENNKKSCCCL